MSAFAFLMCVLLGFVAGVINAFAAGGSFLTLPLLLFLGLPAALANGTNRVGVLAQNIAASFAFHRHDVLDWNWAISASIPTLAGGAVGLWAALHLPEIAFRRILAIVLLLIAIATLLHRTLATGPSTPRSPWHWTMVLGFFAMGVYGGFLQAGVGFLALALTTAAGLDLVRGNAVKVITVLLLTVVSIVVFAGAGHIDWPTGIALAIGNLLGGFVGVKIAVGAARKWLEHILTAVMIMFAVLLWVTN